MRTCVTQGSKHDRLVGGTTRADGVREQGHPQSLGHGVDRRLVDADWSLDAGDQQMVNRQVSQGRKQARGGEGGEGILGEDRGAVAGGGKQPGVRAAELGGHLLGEEDGQTEDAGGGDGQPAAALDILPSGDGGEERRLGVDDNQGGGHAGT